MNAISKAIDIIGGPSKLAAAIGAKPNQVNNWRTRGVPPRFCPAIERAVGHQVTRQELRPSDWQVLWPELTDSDQNRRVTDKVATP